MGRKGLVERVVTEPKGIYAHNEDGAHQHYECGETVFLTPKSAKSMARRLEHPRVAAAKKKAAEEEAAAEQEEHKEALRASKAEKAKKLAPKADKPKADKKDKDGGGS